MIVKEAFVDAHCHIPQILKKFNFLSSFSDFMPGRISPKLLFAVTSCCDYTHINNTLDIINNEPKLYGSFGLHPHNSNQFTHLTESSLRSHLSYSKVLACGEIGLCSCTKCSSTVTMKKQRSVFYKILKIALECHKPLVIHSYKTEQDVVELLFDYITDKNYPIYLHNYLGPRRLIIDFLNHFSNSYIGVSGCITHDAKVKDIIKNIDIHRILLESDGPYHAPNPLRNVISHPGYIPIIAKSIARIHQIDISSVLKITSLNSIKFFQNDRD